MFVTEGCTVKERWMWTVLDGEEKFQLEGVRESFKVPGKVLNEIPALDRYDATANNWYSN